MISDRLRGSIALTSVILAGAVLITSGMAVLFNAMDITIATKSYVSRSFVESKITSCIEEALYRINTNVLYTGSFTVTFADGSCQGNVTIDGSAPTKRFVSVTGTYLGEYILSRTKIVDTSTSPFTLSNF
jgi:hypothetical protein